MCAIGSAKPRGAEGVEETIELRMVEGVEEFGAKLERASLLGVDGDGGKVFEEGDIPLLSPRALGDRRCVRLTERVG